MTTLPSGAAASAMGVANAATDPPPSSSATRSDPAAVPTIVLDALLPQVSTRIVDDEMSET